MRLLSFIASIGIIVFLTQCGTAVEVTRKPAPDLVAIPIDPAQQEIVQIDPTEARQKAAEIERDITAEPGDGLTLRLWATEQLLVDPIALKVDPAGRVYVTGSDRSGGLLDIRSHPTWTTEALAMRSVEDHHAFLRSELAPERSAQNEWLPDHNGDGSRDWRDLTLKKERLYRIEDQSGDGVADLSHTLVEGFNTEITDVLGALLLRGDEIYVAAAPDLWRLRDSSGDSLPDVMESISTGYGPHPGFFGHGMSGLTVGPDGRLYWSVGDMGMNVVGPDGRRWFYPTQGTILRSEPDGSGFEVFAAGLRNTHEFAFDEYGNLISVDNDGDHPGEKERIVYIVEGSDSGWRTHWQFGKYTDPKNNIYKVWMDEELFKPRFDGQAAFITPPVANYHSGPAGMAYNPGTALSEEWRDHFFISEYTGSPATTHVYAFRLEEKGAGFEFAGEKVAAGGILTVGLDFGPDGALYLADWIDGWASKGAGRIWKLDSPEAAASPLRAETRGLLAEGFSNRSERELVRLLHHADLRVRQKAQFELAARGDADPFLDAIRQREHRLGRVHGIWGVWQLARLNPRQAGRLVPLLRDSDGEIRAQAAKVLGDVRFEPSASALIPLLRDADARARFFAAEALGKMKHRPAFAPLVEMLVRNDGNDVYLRHAGSFALAEIGDPEPVVALAGHPSAAVRMAAVIALRRMRHEGAGAFLRDADVHVVTEAARAINDDGGIEGAFPDLASILLTTPFSNEPLLRRVISANLRIGSDEAAARVAAFTAREGAPETMRAESVAALGVWTEPSVLDRVDGAYLGPVRRDAGIALRAAEPLVEPLLESGPPAVKVAVAEAAARLRLANASQHLLARIEADTSRAVRIASLEALHELRDPKLERAVRAALEDSVQDVRMTALGMLTDVGLPSASVAKLLETALERGGVVEQQSALAALARLDSPEAHTVLDKELGRLLEAVFPAETRLDLMEAIEAASSETLRERLTAYRETETPFAETLYGGNRRRGADIVFRHEAAQCMRCHTVQRWGGDVGPNLTNIGAELSREQILEALVEPNARVAPGFGTVSSMPPMGHVLTRREIRDVVEYLSSLK